MSFFWDKCLLLGLFVGTFFSVNGQFKIVDSSNFRVKKGVSNSSNIAFVQINHFSDPSQSRAFSVQQEGVDRNVFKLHIQYRKDNDKELMNMEENSQAPRNDPSFLHRIIASNRNREKYNPEIRRKFKNPPQLTSRSNLWSVDPVHKALIVQENQRILKKLTLQSDEKKRRRPTKISTFKSKCRCVKMGASCPKLQITVHRCSPSENMCCF